VAYLIDRMVCHGIYLRSQGETPHFPPMGRLLNMDLRIIAGSFSDTTVMVVPSSEAGQKFLGFAVESVQLTKSQLQQACEFAAEHGLKISS